MTSARRYGAASAAAPLLGVAFVIARVVWTIACGPFIEDVDTVAPSIDPASLETYAKGELGVVRPQFARRYLVQAYRVLNGKPPLGNLVATAAPNADGSGWDRSGEQQWREALQRVPASGRPGYVDAMRTNATTYQAFLNCNNDAFRVAAVTLGARIGQFG